MFKRCILLYSLVTLISVAFAPSASALEHDWSRVFDTSYNYHISDLCVDPDDNVIVWGAFFGTLDLGGGPLVMPSGAWIDFFLAKFDADGTHLWSRNFVHVDEYAVASGVATDAAGNIYVWGETENSLDLGGGLLTAAGEYDTFLARFSPDGVHAWSRLVGGSRSEGFPDVLVSDAGDIYLTSGSGSDDLDLCGPLTLTGDHGAFLARFDALGACVYARAIDNNTPSYICRSLAFDPAGDLWMTGPLNGTIDLGLGPLSSQGETDILLARFDAATGATEMAVGYGNANEQRPDAIAVDGQGRVFLAGRTWGGLGFWTGDPTGGFGLFTAALDDTAGFVWGGVFPTDDVVSVYDFDLTPEGNPCLTGRYRDALDFGGGPLPPMSQTTGYLATLDRADGTHVESVAFGNPIQSSLVYGLASSSEGRMFVAGWSYWSIDLGGAPLGPDPCAVSDGRGAYLAAYLSGGTGLPPSRLRCVPDLTVSASSAPVDDYAGLEWIYRDPEGGPLLYEIVDNTAPGLVAAAVDGDDFLDIAVHPGLSGHAVITVRATDDSGQAREHGFTVTVTGDTDAPTPRRPAVLHPAAPNPFNPRTRLAFDLAREARVELAVFDAAGRRVRMLVAGEIRGPGRHDVVWDGADDAGRRVEAGVYLVRLRAGETVETARVALIK